MGSGRANNRGRECDLCLGRQGEPSQRTHRVPPSHLIMRNDLTVVVNSANRRLTELALRSVDVAVRFDSSPRTAHSSEGDTGTSDRT